MQLITLLNLWNSQTQELIVNGKSYTMTNQNRDELMYHFSGMTLHSWYVKNDVVHVEIF